MKKIIVECTDGTAEIDYADAQLIFGYHLLSAPVVSFHGTQEDLSFHIANIKDIIFLT
jgi:hypothetical protein